jgi:hypothetical protein
MKVQIVSNQKQHMKKSPVLAPSIHIAQHRHVKGFDSFDSQPLQNLNENFGKKSQTISSGNQILGNSFYINGPV